MPTPTGEPGRAWSLVANADLLGLGRIDAFVDDGSTLVAVGHGGVGPVTSVDGAHWSKAAAFPANPHDNAGPIAAAAVVKDRFVIAASGADFGPTSTLNAVIWESPDGSAWQLATEITAAWDVASLSSNGERLVAGGYTCESISGPCNARLWTTSDLVTWSRSRVQSANGWMITHVAELDGHFVALGQRPAAERAAVAVWTSDDGRQWVRRKDLPNVGDGAAVLSLSRTPRGLAAVGLRGSRAAVWRSTDGTNWMSVPDQPSFDSGVMTSVTASAAEIVAVGGSCDPCDTGRTYPAAEPAIWRSADGLHWTVEHLVFLEPSENAQTVDALIVRNSRWILATHDSWLNRGEETGMSIWVSPPEPAPS